MRWFWLVALSLVVGCANPSSNETGVVNVYGTVSESDYEGPMLNIMVDDMNEWSALLTVSVWHQGMWAAVDYEAISELEGGEDSYVGILDPDQEYLNRGYRIQYIP